MALAVARGELDPKASRMSLHMDRCLHCLACQRLCPSTVNFDRIHDLATALSMPSRSPALNWLLRSVRWPRLLAFGLTLFSSLPVAMRRLLGRLAFAHPGERIARLEDFSGRRLKTCSQEDLKRFKVALHPGCLGQVADKQVLAACINLLKRCNVDVCVLDKAPCCGAMHQHAGDLDQARALQDANYNLACDSTFKYIFQLSPACHRQLAESGHDAFTDIYPFLLQQATDKLRFRRGDGPVSLHISCSHKHHSESVTALKALLQLVPNLDLNTPAGECCGAAGTYMLRHPQQARTLAEGVLTQSSPVLLAANIGCRLHFKAHNDNGIKILHPLEYLQEKLET